MSATLPGSRDIGLYAVDPRTRSMALIYDRPNISEWDAVPVGLTKPRPAALPDQVRNTSDQPATQQKTAQFIVIAGRDSDTAERNRLNERARFVRILQAEYTELAVSRHTSLETRILGTVPLQPDGSVVFEAPAETPLFLETLDARGNRLVLQAGYMAARAGEVKSCAGCHTAVSGAVANSQSKALKFPIPKVTRDASDLSYRRNEPEEYRRQASIGTDRHAPRRQFKAAKLPSPLFANLLDEIPFPMPQSLGASGQKLQRPRGMIRLIFVIRQRQVVGI